MQIADLFVSLGIKGADKTAAAINNVGEGMKKTASMSLEAKAAIIGATYALQRFFANSGQAGTNLSNFNTLLGVSAQTLQQYQYAARQVGVSNAEVENSFKSIQGTLTKTLMGQGAPTGYGRLAALTGGITPEELKKYAEQPQLFLDRLQKYAAKETNAGLRNEVLRSFGMGDSMIAALSKQAFNPKALAKAPTYSDNEIQALDRANIAWSNLGTKIEMAIGHFNAMHGGQIVAEISKITDTVLKLINAFVELADKLEAFKWIGKAFEGWTTIFNGLGTAVDKINQANANPKEKEKLTEEVGNFFKDLPGVFNEITKDIFGKELKVQDIVPQSVVLPKSEKGTTEKPIVVQGTKEAKGGNAPKSESKAVPVRPVSDTKILVPKAENTLKQEKSVLRTEREKTNVLKSEREKTNLKLVTPPAVAVTPDKVKPNMPATVQQQAVNNQNINVNQNMNFGEGKNSREIGDSVKKAVNDAFRQMSSQVQGS